MIALTKDRPHQRAKLQRAGRSSILNAFAPVRLLPHNMLFARELLLAAAAAAAAAVQAVLLLRKNKRKIKISKKNVGIDAQF